jgi:hypothetical protein
LPRPLRSAERMVMRWDVCVEKKMMPETMKIITEMRPKTETGVTSP